MLACVLQFLFAHVSLYFQLLHICILLVWVVRVEAFGLKTEVHSPEVRLQSAVGSPTEVRSGSLHLEAPALLTVARALAAPLRLSCLFKDPDISTT